MSTQVAKIVAAVDFSSYSDSILAYAAVLSERFGAEIIAVTVIDESLLGSVERVFHAEGRDFSAKRFLSDETYRRTQGLRELLDSSLPKHVPRKMVVRSGIVHQEVIKAIQEEAADLLVIGKKGASDLLGQLLGSTAEKLFRHSPVTVLSINGKR